MGSDKRLCWGAQGGGGGMFTEGDKGFSWPSALFKLLLSKKNCSHLGDMRQWQRNIALDQGWLNTNSKHQLCAFPADKHCFSRNFFTTTEPQDFSFTRTELQDFLYTRTEPQDFFLYQDRTPGFFLYQDWLQGFFLYQNWTSEFFSLPGQNSRIFPLPEFNPRIFLYQKWIPGIISLPGLNPRIFLYQS